MNIPAQALFGWTRRLAVVFFSLGACILFGTAAPLPAAAAQTIPAAQIRKADGTLNLATGLSGSLDLSGWTVTLDSKRGPVLSPASPAEVPANGWRALAHQGLGGGPSHYVDSLAVIGSDVYVGGAFTSTYDGAVSLNHIARYSGGAWHALPHGGLNGEVYALGVWGTDLYAGGSFNATSDGARTNLSGIAKFSNNDWSGLPHGGLNGMVFAFAVHDSSLFVGGGFTQTADGQVTGLNNIARLRLGQNNNLRWEALANQGINSNGIVFALAEYRGALYVGGGFYASGDRTILNLNNIASYSNSSWHALPNSGLNGLVYALTPFEGFLYAGGSFSTTYDGAVTPLNNIARYQNDRWYLLPDSGLNAPVLSFAVYGSELYVGGNFEQTVDGNVKKLGGIAKFIGYFQATPKPQPRNYVNALAIEGTELYAAGDFGGSGTNFQEVARLLDP